MQSKQKKTLKMNELYWLFGNIFCAIGVALCTKSGFGLSMIAAPPFILNQYLVRFSSFFSQGACEYVFQAVLLLIMCVIIRKFNWKYIFSFATAFVFGNMVDAALWVLGGQAVYQSLTLRIIAFVVSETVISLSIACYFRTSLPLCVYELFVVAVADRFNTPTHKIKMIFDISMLLLSLGLSLILFKDFVGVGIGTVIVTVVNSHLIRLWGILLDKLFSKEPLFPKMINALN